jgi:parvulin-like peptidyl-prolyl isomerase
MSDDEITKVFSAPPPPTDEIDSEWNMKAEADKLTATAAAERASTPASDSGAPSVNAQLKKELAGQGETAAAPGTPPATISNEEDDSEQDDEHEDEDQEDEDDDEHEHEDEVLATDGHAEIARKARSDSSDDWLPDWAPWLLLGVLVTVGVAGGLGLFTHPRTEGDFAAPASQGAAPSAPTSIEASHFLVQYQGSMRAPPTITRTKDEAKKRAEEGLAKVKAGADFAKIVGEYSDEPGALARGGALGSFTRETMIKQFSDVAFELKVNQISGVIETPFGFHVIKRTK